MSLGVYPGRETPSRLGIQSLLDLSSFQMAGERQLTRMEVEINGPLYLSDSDRTAKVTDALAHLMEYSGYKSVQ